MPNSPTDITPPLDPLKQLLFSFFHTVDCGMLMLKASPSPLEKTKKYHCLLANKLLGEYFDLEPTELLGKEVDSILPAEFQLKPELDKVLAQKEKHTLIVSSQNDDKRFEVNIYPLEDDHCALSLLEMNSRPYLGPDGNLVDNSMQLDLTSAAQIIASLGDPFCVVDKEFIVRFENEAAQNLWGNNVGQPCHMAYQQSETVCEECQCAKAFKDGKTHRVEKQMQTAIGERDMEIVAAPVKDQNGEIIAAVQICHDITPRKLTEKGKVRLIQELQADLAKVQRLRGLLPICPICKKIKDEKGLWTELESFFRSRAEVEFSQVICDG